MLSDEEKKALDLLKNIDKQKCVMLECPVVKNNIERQLKIIELNRIIRKQSKEIQRLEARKYMYNAETGEISQIPLNDNHIHKDKIKAKIEELEKDIQYSANPLSIDNSKFAIEILQSLIEKE